LTAFFAAYALFVLTEAYIAVQFAKSGKKIFLRETLSLLIGFSAAAAARFLFWPGIPLYALALAMAVLFAHSFCGNFLSLYLKSKWFDRALHAFGSFSFALLLYFIIASVFESGGSKPFRALFILFLGTGSGSFFEIFEYSCDRKQDLKMQKGLKDTVFDMVFNLIGSFAAAVFAGFFVL